MNSIFGTKIFKIGAEAQTAVRLIRIDQNSALYKWNSAKPVKAFIFLKLEIITETLIGFSLHLQRTLKSDIYFERCNIRPLPLSSWFFPYIHFDQ